jgi:hypothetical protein
LQRHAQGISIPRVMASACPVIRITDVTRFSLG